MSRSSVDRVLAYRLGSAYDCWGRRRSLRRGIQNGIWIVDGSGLEVPAHDDDPSTESVSREVRLDLLRKSGAFTATELATLDALVVDRQTIDEIATSEGRSRQAIVARLIGNSRGQGGILKKARRLLESGAFNE